MDEHVTNMKCGPFDEVKKMDNNHENLLNSKLKGSWN